jgi:hypothetical protein
VPEACVVWAIRALWWGRNAKIAAILGALVILLDIIGADRIKRTAEFGERGTKRLLKGGINLFKAFRGQMRDWLTPVIAIWGLYLGASYFASWLSPSAARWLNEHGLWSDVVMTIIVVALGVIPVLWIIALAVLGVIRLPFWWLSKPYVALTFRWFALMMILMGFAIDMAVN